ncbi:MAG: aminotransferase class IV [Pyrinomonadaceae bacterium]
MNSSSFELYGKGVFTTVAIRSRESLFWDKHWRRLSRDAAKIGLDLSAHTDIATETALNDSIGASGIVDGRARITLTDERPAEIWPGSKPEQNTSVYIIVGENRPVPSPVMLTVSLFPVNSRSPLAGVKSCNYLENTLAIDEAKGCGFHEAIRVNERGHVTSGCMANVFWLVGGKLFTPALSTGCLPGTTREFVLENSECEEVEAEIGELGSAEAIFLTSAGLGVVAVNEFDGRTLGGRDHRIVQVWRDLETK